MITAWIVTGIVIFIIEVYDTDWDEEWWSDL